MTLRQYIGLFLLLTPFIGIAILGITSIGILPTLGVFAGVALIVAVITVGAYFTSGIKKHGH